MPKTLNGRSAASVEPGYYCASTRLPLAFDKHYKFCIIRFSLSFLVHVFLVCYSIRQLSGLFKTGFEVVLQEHLMNTSYALQSTQLRFVVRKFTKMTTNTPIVCVLWKRADERCSSFIYKKSLNNAFSPKNVCSKKYYSKTTIKIFVHQTLKKKIISSNKFLELKIGFSKNQFWKKNFMSKMFPYWAQLRQRSVSYVSLRMKLF